MTIFEQINLIPAEEIISALNLTLAKDKKSYVCLLCGNGTGKSGDGIRPRKNSRGFIKWKCFSCGEDFSNYDLLEVAFGTVGNYAETLRLAKIKFKWLTDDFTLSESRKYFAPMTGQTEQKISVDVESKVPPRKSYKKFYAYAQFQIPAFIKTCGGRWRGLTLETLRYFKCGYAPAFGRLKTPRVIIPTNEFQCLARLAVEVEELNLTAEEKKSVVPKQRLGEEKEIFQARAIESSDYPVFIVEGEIDCMSIWQATQGKLNVCAIGGAGKYRKVLENVEIFSGEKKFIVMFDNDSAGRENALKLVEGFEKLRIKAVSFVLDDSAKIDCNDLLQRDEGTLVARLWEIIRKANEEFENMVIENSGSESLMKDTGIEKLAEVLDGLDEMTEKLKGGLLKWGFPKLDEKLPMLPGCYLLGALPSLGKTTFALNVCENVCEQGAAVLYISYEPTVNQIAVKDLAGYWFRKVWANHRDNRSPELVPTATQMMLGRYNEMFGEEEMKEVREELKSKRKNFYFLQGRKETARDLISKIKSYVDNGVKFIVIDYIQLLKGTDSSKTVREQIDETIQELQRFQSEKELVILFISAFNRENYRNYACLESFKESGGLEYTADAILAMQFEYSKSDKPRGNIEEFQKKKQSQPRDMELVCLKNRFGIDFTDRFAYHSAHETFIEKKSQNNEIADEEVDED